MDVTSAMKRNLGRKLLKCGMTILNEYRKDYRKPSCTDHHKKKKKRERPTYQWKIHEDHYDR
jgi:hypothetical protein